MPECLHRTIKIIIDDGKTVTVIIKRFPSGEIEVLTVVCKIHTLLQNLLASHWRKCVQIDADYKICIICDKRSQLIIHIFFVELKLIKLCIIKIKSLSVLLYIVLVYVELYTGRFAWIVALQVNRFDELSYLVTVMLKLHGILSFFEIADLSIACHL